MKNMKALLLILGQYVLDKDKLDKCLKSLPMILDWQGPHEKPEGSCAGFGSMGAS